MAIYKRTGSKYYWFKFYFNGELVQQSTKCTSKVKAREVEAAFRHELVLGRIGIKPKAKAPTFKQAVEDFLKLSEVEHADKPNSFVRIKYSCRSLINYFGQTKVDGITPQDVEKFILDRCRQTSKKTGHFITRDTVNLELIALKTIFRRLVAADILLKSPAKEVKQLSENERSFHVISADEQKLYLLAAPQPLQDVAALMIETGMRPNELYQLTRQNVNIENGWLKIENSKTRSSNRKVWLSDKAAAILQNRLDRFKGDYLFPKGEKDFAPATYQLNAQHLDTLKRAGLKFRLYDCRHTFATRAIESGIDLLTLASMLGHSSLEQVMRYAHPSETRKSDAIIKMQRTAAKSA